MVVPCTMNARSLGVLALLAVFAQLASARPWACPSQCECSAPGGEREYDCALASAHIVVKMVVNEYVKIVCKSGVLLPTELSELKLAPSHGGELSLVSLTQCDPLPTLEEVLAALDASTLRSLNLFGTAELKEEHVKGLEGLRQLRIYDAVNQSSVPYRILELLPVLTEFRLVGASVELTPEGFAASPASLQLLELGNDHLNDLPVDGFRGLEKLPRLSLWGNKIENITTDSFRGLESMQYLDLSRNRLTSLPARAFAEAPQLKSVKMFANPLRLISTDAFGDLPKLEEITAFDNSEQLVLSSRSLASLPISSLLLTNCRIHSLPEDLLVNSSALLTVDFKNNVIRELLAGVFRDQKRVKSLNLARNQIEELPYNVFWGLRALETLVLDSNRIQVLPEQLFSGLTRLRTVSASRNLLRHVAPDAFRGAPVRTLTLSHNRLTLLPIDIASGAKHGVKSGANSGAEALIVSTTNSASGDNVTSETNVTNATHSVTSDTVLHNVTSVPVTVLNTNVTSVTVTNEAIPFNTNFTFDYDFDTDFGFYEDIQQQSPFNSLLDLQVLDLRNNSINQIFYDWQFLLTNLKKLDLRENKVTEVLSLQFLSSHIVVNLDDNLVTTVALTVPPLGYPPSPPSGGSLSLSGNPLHCDCNLYPLLLRMRGELPMMVPEVEVKMENARCATPSQLTNKLITNLSPSVLTCPTECPLDCTCDIRPYTSRLEVTCPTPPTNITIPPEATTVQLRLTTQTTNLKLPDAVTILKLNDIRLKELPNIPETIQELDLSGNELTVIPLGLLQSNISLYLSKNPFVCDCFSEEFIKSIQTSNRIKDAVNVTCDSGQQLLTVDTDRLCSVIRAAWLGGLLAALGAIVAITAALAYKYSLEIKVFMYSREWLRWMIKEDDLDKDKLYDAFVSYSHQDEKFVVEKLMPALEQGNRPFKLCVHFRDWIIGEWIPAQIANSVEKSRRTIIVLSKHFVESVWGTLEFRIAHIKSQQEKRTRLVIILLEDSPDIDSLDTELKSYLSTNTYVKYGDPWFWEKLRYALAGRRLDEKVEKRARTLGDRIVKNGLHEKLARDGKVVGGGKPC